MNIKFKSKKIVTFDNSSGVELRKSRKGFDFSNKWLEIIIGALILLVLVLIIKGAYTKIFG